MLTFIAKRVFTLIPVLFFISVIVFLIIYLIPGDPAKVILGDNATAESVAQLQNDLGLNEPMIKQYFTWITNVFQGDLGQSFFLNQPVLQAIIEHIGPTLSLAILAEIFAVVIAVPFGIWAASHREGFVDKALTAFSLFGIAIPGFLLSLFLVMIFAVMIQIFPVAGYAPLSDGLVEHLKFLILPAISLGVVQASLIARITRSSMLDVLNESYIRTALSKGISEQKILYKHVLRNAFMPILTVIGGSFGTLVAGAAVIETIFNIPGLGQMMVQSVTRRDYPVIQGTILFIAFFYVMINLIVDILYVKIDPRVRI
ncbi:ABC transporter permease [Ureibacillus sp. NPDC094379]